MADEAPVQQGEVQANAGAPEQPQEADSVMASDRPAEATVATTVDVAEEPTDEEAGVNDEELRANEVAFDWQASEYVQHNKGVGWYTGLVAGIVILSVIAALLQYWLEIAALVVMGVAIVVYARRPPRTLTYELTPKGIIVDGKEYPFTEFRSFGVITDEDWHTIDLIPTKRFSPPMGILFGDGDFDTIIGHLELHLPRVDRDPDVVERLTKLLRF